MGMIHREGLIVGLIKLHGIHNKVSLKDNIPSSSVIQVK